MAETIRCFMAFELPETVRKEIDRIQERLKERGIKARWVDPDNVHLTLHFFGEVEELRIDSIRQAANEAAAGCRPLSLTVKGLGVFPGIRKARVVWAGIDGDIDLLTDLHRRLEQQLERADFPKEKRSFRPHLTLGRFKKPPKPNVLADAVESFGDFAAGPFRASHLVLFQSRLEPGGAVYTKIFEIPLAAGAEGSAPAGVDGRST